MKIHASFAQSFTQNRTALSIDKFFVRLSKSCPFRFNIDAHGRRFISLGSREIVNINLHHRENRATKANRSKSTIDCVGRFLYYDFPSNGMFSLIRCYMFLALQYPTI